MMNNPSQTIEAFLPNQALFTTAYFPPISYFAAIFRHQSFVLDYHEHYQKGSYRNRCYLGAANGVLMLNIPLEKGKNNQQSIGEVRISYHEAWHKKHWQSIQSGYGKAPFFEYYADDLQSILLAEYRFLWDLNLALLQVLLAMLNTSIQIETTSVYHAIVPENTSDFRLQIHPKQSCQSSSNIHYKAVSYPQVFEARNGFLPNLSILDLLFCTGSESVYYLSQR